MGMTVCAVGAVASTAPSPRVVIQAFGGAPLNTPTTLKISQAGFPDLEHEASWTTKPLDQPFYWALRIRWQQETTGWELQLLHHKLHLRNVNADIEHFEVTHGYNTLTAHHVWRLGRWHVRLGAGVVLPHAESTIRGRYAGTGPYRVRGPAALAGVGWEQPLGRHVLATAEAQGVAAVATTDVAGGRARVRAVGLHLLVGIGVAF
jgi:hypothetical protein